ncbi:hypothetical protein [Flavobacterium rhizosphaerae]|uniref:HEPN domain-containing protein n=1 Tax=Flavobacterium rhizosphaerae TaxID=3163298 RepID=A0ABW8YVV0_9FLAO
MDYSIKIPQSYSDTKRLEEAVRSVVGFLHADAVYVSLIGENEQGKIFICTILSDGYYQELEEFQNSKVVESHPDFIFKFFSADWAKHAFEKGLPLFIEHCYVGKLVYAQPEVKVFYPSQINTKLFVKRIEFRFREMMWATDACLKNYKDLNRSERTLEATFCLHQALRYLLMSVSELYGDSFIGSNSLYEQYQWVINFAPQLKEILDYNTEEGLKIIETLDAAYYSVYFKELGMVEKQNVDKAFETVETLSSFFGKQLKQKLKNYASHLSSTVATPFIGLRILQDKLSGNYKIEAALLQISDIIYGYIHTRSAFCFGYRLYDSPKRAEKYYRDPSFHFYIVVFSLEHKDNAASAIEAKVRDLLNGKYKVTILLHRKQSLRKKRDNDRWFLNKLISNGLQIGSSLEIEERTITRDVQESVCYWYDRQLAADSFLASAAILSQDDEALVKNSLLHQVAVNLSLGLIELYLSYRPNRINIGHLLSLLEYVFEKDFADDFKRKEDSSLYVLLAANPDMARYKDVKQYSISDSNRLETLCRGFYESALKLANEQIEKLKNNKDGNR